MLYCRPGGFSFSYLYFCMSQSSSTSLWLVLGSLVVVVLLIALAVSQKGGGAYDGFAKCLNEKGVKAYTAYWCPNCTNQKKLFGDSWGLVNDKECAIRGSSRNLSLCEVDGVTSVPTWEFADGSRLSGTQPLDVLAERSGCALDASEASGVPEGSGASSTVPVSEGLDIEVTSDAGVTIGDISATPVSE